MEIVNLILSSIIVVAMPLIFVKIILNLKIKEDKRKVLISIIISLMLYILIYRYSTDIYKSLCNIIICSFLINQSYNLTIKKTIIMVVSFIIVLVLSELIAINLLKCLGMPVNYIYESFAGSLTSNLAVFVIMVALTFVIKATLQKIINNKNNINTKIVIFSILTLISILVFFYDVIASFRVGSMTIFYIIAIITFTIALIIVINQENKNTKLKLEYNKLLEFMENYEVELENQRILKHEYKNQLITIKSKLIDNDKKNKVIDYINDILDDNTKFSQEAYTKLQYLPANGIKALFYFKISEAKNKGINTSVNIASSVKKSILKDLTTKEFKDLGILIGVYLDNAIEASIQSDKKILGIEMYDTDDGITMIISNSYKGTIEENKVGKTHFSTKGKGRGYGLMLVSSTLRGNKKFTSEREITSTLYIQTVTIKNSLQ